MPAAIRPPQLASNRWKTAVSLLPLGLTLLLGAGCTGGGSGPEGNPGFSLYGLEGTPLNQLAFTGVAPAPLYASSNAASEQLRGVYRNSGDGSGWQRRVEVPCFGLATVPGSATELFALLDYNLTFPDYLYHSVDGGSVWEPVNEPLPTVLEGELVAVQTHPWQAGALWLRSAGNQSGALYVSTSGGQQWNRVAETVAPALFHPQDARKLFTLGSSGLLTLHGDYGRAALDTLQLPGRGGLWPQHRGMSSSEQAPRRLCVAFDSTVTLVDLGLEQAESRMGGIGPGQVPTDVVAIGSSFYLLTLPVGAFETGQFSGGQLLRLGTENNAWSLVAEVEAPIWKLAVSPEGYIFGRGEGVWLLTQ